MPIHKYSSSSARGKARKLISTVFAFSLVLGCAAAHASRSVQEGRALGQCNKPAGLSESDCPRALRAPGIAPDPTRWAEVKHDCPAVDPHPARWAEVKHDCPAVDPPPSPRLQPPRVNRRREAIKPQDSLPTQKVCLRFHDANLVEVFRALARSVNKNIMCDGTVTGTASMDIKNVPWDDAFRALLKLHSLSYEQEGDIIRVMSLQDMENEVQRDQLLEKQKALSVSMRQTEPLVLKVVPVRYANPVQLQKKLEDYLPKDNKGKPRGSIGVDTHTNSLLINATEACYTRMLHLIEEVDKPTAQIRIAASIVDMTKDAALALGVQWGGFLNQGNFSVTPGGTDGQITTNPDGSKTLSYTPLTGVSGIGGQGMAVNLPADVSQATTGALNSLGLIYGKLGSTNLFELQLSALQSQGKLKILSSPSITTLDNQTAFTENGESVPYVSTTSLGSTEVKFEDAVLRLQITPHIIAKDLLEMNIVVKNDNVDFTHEVAGNPVLIKKQTQTNLIDRSGETIVISGLSTETKSSGTDSVPGLGKVPILGALFKSSHRSDTKEEVFIFITPYILGQGGSINSEASRPFAVTRENPKLQALK